MKASEEDKANPPARKTAAKKSTASRKPAAKKKAGAAKKKTVRRRKPIRLKKVLVPTDFSDRSKKALKYAARFAEQFDAEITLLHVVEVRFAGAEAGVIDLIQLEADLRESGKNQLERIADEEISEGIRIKTAVRTGSPYIEICELAKENDIDMIVISTHGYTGLKHVFLGSTAERIVRHAPCPILTVRQEEHEFIT